MNINDLLVTSDNKLVKKQLKNIQKYCNEWSYEKINDNSINVTLSGYHKMFMNRLYIYNFRETRYYNDNPNGYDILVAFCLVGDLNSVGTLKVQAWIAEVTIRRRDNGKLSHQNTQIITDIYKVKFKIDGLCFLISDGMGL